MPQFCYIKVGFKGVYIARTCFRDVSRPSLWIALVKATNAISLMKYIVILQCIIHYENMSMQYTEIFKL